MKKNMYILIAVCCLSSLAWSLNPMDTNTTFNWYGQGSLLSDQEFSDNQNDDDDDIQRKRRHRRRRKIRPAKKGW